MGTGNSSEQSDEQAICLLVDDWREGSPSVVLVHEDDVVPFDGPLDDCLNPGTRFLEFRFNFPVNYPGGKPRFLNVTQSLLSNRATLGIKSLFLGKSAQDYVDALNKSRHGRIKWSDTFVAYGCQISWTEDRDDSSMTNFRFRIDEDESAVAIVDRENPIFFGTLDNEKVRSSIILISFPILLTYISQRKFADAIVLPLRILLRVIWWRELFGNAGIDFHAGSFTALGSGDTEEMNPQDEWWWPIVLEAQQRAKAKAAAAAAAAAVISASTSLPAAEDNSQEPAEPVKKKTKRNRGRKRKTNHRDRGKNTTRTPDADVKTEEERQTPESPSSHAYISASENLPTSDTVNSPEDQETAAASESGMVTCPTSPTPETESPAIDSVPETALLESPVSLSLITQTSCPESPPRDSPYPEAFLSETPVPEGASISGIAGENITPENPVLDGSLLEVSPHEPTSTEIISPDITFQHTASTVTAVDASTLAQQTLPFESQPSEAGISSKTELLNKDRSEKPIESELLISNTTTQSDQICSPILLSHSSATSVEKGEVVPTESQKQHTDSINFIRERTQSRSSLEESTHQTQQTKDLSDNQGTLETNTGTANDKKTMAKKKHAKKKKRPQRQQKNSAIAQNDAHQSCPSQTTVETCPPIQTSSCPASAPNTTQVPISSSDSSSLKHSLRNPKATSGTLTKETKSSLDPLASEYVPNFKSSQKAVTPPKEYEEYGSGVSDNSNEKALSPSRSIQHGRSANSPSKSAIAKSPLVNVSNKSYRHSISHASHSSQPSSTDDLITQSLTALQDDQRCALLTSQRRSTISSFTSSTLLTRTPRTRETAFTSRLKTTDRDPRKKSPNRIGKNRAELQDTGSFNLIRSGNEYSAASNQPSSVSGQSPNICSQPFSTSTDNYQAGHFSSIPPLNRLPPIQEATIERVQDDKTFSTNRHSTYTPSHSHPNPVDTESITTSTQDTVVHLRSGFQSPQRPSTTKPIHDQGNVPRATSQLVSSHAHPSPPSTTRVRSSVFGQGGPIVRLPAGFFWQLDSHGFPCTKTDCDKRCSSWDGASVICPRCGPFSEVRYCSQDHLYEDIKPHWAFCGQMTFRHPCRESTIPRHQKEGPPLLPSRHNWDTPERHRQAVYHATNSGGDYFIFADWAEFMTAGQPVNNVGVRCTNRVLAVVQFDEPEEKDRFRRVLGVCLFGKPKLSCTSLHPEIIFESS